MNKENERVLMRHYTVDLVENSKPI